MFGKSKAELQWGMDFWKDKSGFWEARAKSGSGCPQCLDRELAAIEAAEKLRRESKLRAIIKPIVREELAAAKRNRS